MKENSICDDFKVSATLPAISNFNAMVVKSWPNKLSIPPNKSMPLSLQVFGITDPSIDRAIITDVIKPTTPKQVSAAVGCRP